VVERDGDGGARQVDAADGNAAEARPFRTFDADVIEIDFTDRGRQAQVSEPSLLMVAVALLGS
jgi:hypothetical protein